MRHVCELIAPVFGLLFWGLPFLAVYWIRKRKKVPGASLRLGTIALTGWILSFPLLILSFYVGLSKLEGNDPDDCWAFFAVFALLVGAYAALANTLNAKPTGGDPET